MAAMTKMIKPHNTSFLTMRHAINRYAHALKFITTGTANVLDAGCGSGYGSDYLFNAGCLRVTGIDIDQDATNYGFSNYLKDTQFLRLQYYPVNVFTDDITTRSNSHTDVIAMNVLEHCASDQDRERFVYRLQNILRPAGKVIVSINAANFTATDILLHKYFWQVRWYQAPLPKSKDAWALDTLSAQFDFEMQKFRNIFKCNKKPIDLSLLSDKGYFSPFATDASREYDYIAVCNNAR